eukprot:CAMPEP_0117681280 /NCGR_PEP_ID=MMETSP0804-20121206/18870_1 /TAXON_ID=1074897 /ORGANISM="Tetraselmis astigmatica, Strain CCMP880" /LENGTH=69 /DNA_ID=CAMNT_0005490971 /DNA_START=672 /DNA_END=878 /DNA_ORIENTATION=-
MVHQDLWRHPPKSSNLHYLVGLPVIPQAAQPKVGDFQLPADVEKKVGRLQVTVHQAGDLVDVLQAISKL